jgi:undecaprenyl-diphosphatase
MDSLQAFDEGALYWFETHNTPWLTSVLRAATHLGGNYVTLAVTLGGALALFWGRRPRTAVCLMAVALLSYLLSEGVRAAVARPRPDVRWARIKRPASASFPSGHTFDATAIYGALALTAARAVRRRLAQALIVLAGLGVAAVVGVSRVYLGVHYPLDVVGGWAGGLGFAFLALWADQRWGYRAPQAPDGFPSPPEGGPASEAIRAAGPGPA